MGTLLKFDTWALTFTAHITPVSIFQNSLWNFII